jgi:hypothetical protein
LIFHALQILRINFIRSQHFRITDRPALDDSSAGIFDPIKLNCSFPLLLMAVAGNSVICEPQINATLLG